MSQTFYCNLSAINLNNCVQSAQFLCHNAHKYLDIQTFGLPYCTLPHSTNKKILMETHIGFMCLGTSKLTQLRLTLYCASTNFYCILLTAWINRPYCIT